MNIFIINPKAGNEKGVKLTKILNNQENTIFHVTTKPKDATEYVSYITKKYPNSIIYSVGGDGTLNEVVNGMTNTNSKLHVVPFGSGNDYNRIIKDVNEIKVDVGEVNNKKFINISSFGIDAEIVEKVNRDNIQFLKYQRNILSTFLKYQKKEISLNDQQLLINILAICKGKYYGNGIPINPNYNLNDGLFNVIAATDLNTLKLIKTFFKIFNGTHLNIDGINTYQINKLKIESENPIYCNLDGEIFKGTSFNYQLIKDGITITNDIPPKIKSILYNK